MVDNFGFSYDLDDLSAVKNRLAREVREWSGCFAGAAVGMIAKLADKYAKEAEVLSARAKDLRRPDSWNDLPGAEASHWGDD